MKRIFTYLFLMAFSVGVAAQLTVPFTFETAMADTGWYSFANGALGTDTGDVKMAPNPDKTGINKSDSVISFNVYADASPWAGMYTDYLQDPMVFTDNEHTLYMMVFKTIISPCAMKIEVSLDGGVNQELKVDNTLTDEWELLSFDLSPAIGFSYTRLTVFPDFPAVRAEGTLVYMDNFSSVVLSTSIRSHSGNSIKIFPNPVETRMAVQYPGMKGLTISNVLGETVKSVNFRSTNSKVIELSDLKSGIYFITVASERGSFTSKFMKK